MPYKPCQLGDVYRYMTENDQSGLRLARWKSLGPIEFKRRLMGIKNTDPNLYGTLLVDLYVNTQTRPQLMEFFKS